jgi:hypothetical protein
VTHDELLALIKRKDDGCRGVGALLAVMELHTPVMGNTLELCKECNQARRIDDPVITYPCRTIEAIEKELV